MPATQLLRSWKQFHAVAESSIFLSYTKINTSPTEHARVAVSTRSPRWGKKLRLESPEKINFTSLPRKQVSEPYFLCVFYLRDCVCNLSKWVQVCFASSVGRPRVFVFLCIAITVSVLLYRSVSINSG